VRVRALIVSYLAAALIAGVSAVALAHAELPPRPVHPAAATPSPVPAAPSASPFAGHLQVVVQQPPGPPTLRAPADPGAVPAPSQASFFGWALVDRRTGEVSGSANKDTGNNTTESMIKVWIAADYLRKQDAPNAGALAELTRMIVDSDDNMAIKYYDLNGGDSSVRELITLCGLRHTSPSGHNEWSYTNMPPADAAALGVCVGTGKAAGPKWTPWLLTTMRNVRGGVADQQRTTGGGHWGIIDGLPAALAGGTSIKNGWTAQTYDHNWHVNCLAIHADWVLAVELRYPWTSPDGDWHHANNLQTGADGCAAVTRALLTSTS